MKKTTSKDRAGLKVLADLVRSKRLAATNTRAALELDPRNGCSVDLSRKPGPEEGLGNLVRTGGQETHIKQAGGIENG